VQFAVLAFVLIAKAQVHVVLRALASLGEPDAAVLSDIHADTERLAARDLDNLLELRPADRVPSERRPAHEADLLDL